jgi:PIN domain nuclease of toxin-antitoxin system
MGKPPVSKPRYVLDASALLCLLFEEDGAEQVAARLPGAMISAVSYSEVIAKLVDRGMPADEIVPLMADLDIELVPVDRAQAEAAGLLGAGTRARGLSTGDRASLALAQSRGAVALTADRGWADRGWADLAAGVTVEWVRPA